MKVDSDGCLRYHRCMTFTYKNLKINYNVLGDGPSILLLHGWGGTIESLMSLQKQLAQLGYRVFNFDLPGFGNSSPPAGAFTLDDFAAVFEDFIRKKVDSEVTLFGHSFGGSVCVKIAARANVSIRALILCNSSGIRKPLGLKANLLQILSKCFKALFSLPMLRRIYPGLRKYFYYYVLRNRDYIDHQKIAETYTHIVREDITADLGNVFVPTLLLWGENDTTTPLSFAEIMHSHIPDSKIKPVPGATHGLPLHEPQLVADEISVFLR